MSSAGGERQTDELEGTALAQLNGDDVTHDKRKGDPMTPRRIVGLVLVVVGIVALLWGGVFWTDRETLLDAGPLEVTTQERDGVAIPPILGVIALVGGIVLLVVPDRRRVR